MLVVQLPDSVTDLMMRTANLLHRTVLTVSGGRIGSQAGPMPVVELRHVGRKSGKEYRTLLTSPLQENGGYVLVASKGGDDRDPDWYRNLVAHPDVDLVARGTTIPVTARTATDEERAELWPRIEAVYKGYAGYQARTDRVIPVVICEPRE